MHCKHCGAALEEQQTICPECGTLMTEETTTAALPEEDFEATLPDGDYDEYEQYEDFEKAPASKPKKNLGLIAAIAALCVVVIAAAVLLLGRDKSPYTGPMESDQYIVAEYKDHKLTNQTFMYYYWAQFYQLYSQYGNYITQLGLDLNKPFEKQPFGNEGLTWADFFTDYAIKQWSSEVTVADAAKAEGFTLSEAQQTALEKVFETMESEAAKAGYDDKVAYLKNAFDLSADWDSYVDYTTTTYINSAYVSQKYNTFLAAGQADPGQHKHIYYIDIRHVLIKFADSTEASKAAAKAQAEALYETFKEDPTMDHFAQLAKEHSADGSASSGGLIEGVYPGQMVENFDKWCFTEGRKAGDHGLIESEYGWHLMFFDGTTDVIFKTAAESYADEAYDAWQSGLLAGNATIQYRDKITFRHAK